MLERTPSYHLTTERSVCQNHRVIAREAVSHPHRVTHEAGVTVFDAEHTT